VGDARNSLAQRGLTRPASGKLLGGVCAGLARRFGIPKLAVRLGFVVSILLPGPQILAYAALWVLMPPDRS